MIRYATVSLLFVLGACAQPQPEAAPAPTPAPTPAARPAAPAPATAGVDEAAQQAALQWLRIVDAGEYRRSWEEGGQLMREGVTAEQWEQAAQQARAAQGAVTTRELRQAQRMTEIPGAPEGEYVGLMFETQFATGRFQEQVIMAREADGRWRAIGYFIRP